MAFPFTIKYSKSLSKKLTDDEMVKALSYIDGFIREKSAKNVVLSDGCLSYKGSTSGFNWNIFNCVDKGVFKIINEGAKTVITYEFFMYHLFIFVSIAGIAAWIYIQSYVALLVCFGWLGGMNWIIAVIRHSGMFEEIKGGIETLLTPAEQRYTEKEKEPDDKLKSWF